METNLTVKLNNGTSMPLFGLGTWQIPAGKESSVIETAVRVGYRRFDCSRYHGNQAAVGAVFKKLFVEGVVRREDLFITDKFPLGSDVASPEMIKPVCKEILNALGLDYIDSFQIHSFSAFRKGSGYDHQLLAKLWEAMEELVESGLVRTIAVTNFTITKLRWLMQTAKITPVVNQVEFSPYLQQPKLRAYCQSKGIVVEAYGPIGSPGRPDSFKSKDDPVILDDPVVKDVAAKHGATAAQVCLAFALACKVAPTPKSSNEKRIVENFRSVSVSLDEHDISRLLSLDRNVRIFKWSSYAQGGQTLDDIWDVPADAAFVI